MPPDASDANNAATAIHTMRLRSDHAETLGTTNPRSVSRMSVEQRQGIFVGAT